MRNEYIGASEVGAIVSGCDEYGKTPLTIYMEKLGLRDKNESEIMSRGNDLERILFNKFQEQEETTGLWLYQPCAWEEPLTHEDYPWLGCHPDAWRKKAGHILELKLVSSDLPLPDKDEIEWLKVIRPSWYWQAQTQLAITGFEKVILFVWVNNQFAWHHQFTLEIPANKDDIKTLVEKTHEFFYTNIKGNKIPEYVEEKPIELKTDWVETDKQLVQDIEDFAVMSEQIHGLQKSFDNLKDKLKSVYSEKPYKSILAGQILLRANMKSGASRLSKDRCIASGLDLTGCYERGKPVYTLEVVRRKDNGQ